MKKDFNTNSYNSDSNSNSNNTNTNFGIKGFMNKVKNFIKNMFDEDEFNTSNFSMGETTNSVVIDNSSIYSKNTNSLSLDTETLQVLDTTNDKVFQSIDVNLEYIKSRFNTMINSDIKVREFTLNARNKQYKAFIIYIDGMVDQDIINNYILKPLMLKNRSNSFDGDQNRVLSEVKTNNITVRKVKKFDIVEYISSCLLPQNTIEKCSKFDSVASGINSGNCALFIDTLDIAFDIEVKGFEKRGLETPENEIVIRGAQIGFTENLRTNTSLLRRYINNENLIIESVDIGKISKTSCAICYLKNVANSDLVAEVRYRLNNLDIDYLISSGQLEQLIQDNDFSSLPQVISTQRPDKCANLLFDGRVAIVVNGGPYVLIVPVVFYDFLSSPEDLNLKHQYANFTRILRIVAFAFALLLPGLYMAIVNFHQEIIPTELLFTIVSSRSVVPFPILFEMLIMDFSFELIREASIRVPSPVGQTIGIVRSISVRSSSS